MAILLHDCGMYLTQDMCRDLIADSSPALVIGLGDVPWAILWAGFLSEAGRFGQEKLKAIFGDARPIKLSDLVLDDLGERDCLLIGEFVRRHHSRIAHEIAVKGIFRESGVALEPMCSILVVHLSVDAQNFGVRPI
jgi:molecular chaperone HtpG